MHKYTCVVLHSGVRSPDLDLAVRLQASASRKYYRGILVRYARMMR